jgi:hypothetical protein
MEKHHGGMAHHHASITENKTLGMNEIKHVHHR